MTDVPIHLRRLHHRARPFTWRAKIGCVRCEADCHRCIRVRAWGAGKNGQALHADLLSTTWPASWPTWEACADDGAYPTAADIRSLIDYALDHGWRPDTRGGRFVLTEHEHAAHFAPPAFLLTDRLRTPDPTARVIRAHEIAHAASPG